MKNHFFYLLTIILFSASINLAQTSSPTNSQTTGAEAKKYLFNVRPFKDFAAQYGTQILNKEIDINAPLEIIVIGVLDDHGKITDAKANFKSGDNVKTQEVFKSAVAALSDSQLLQPFYDYGARSIKITVAQNPTDLQVMIQMLLPTEGDARRMSSGINLALSMAKTKYPDTDEIRLVEKMTFGSRGNISILNFAITHDEKNEMIEKNLTNVLKSK